MLPSLSDEQQCAIDVWNRHENQVCSAAAGSGKSTLLLHACINSTEPVLILTYNKLLEVEMSAKLDSMNMTQHKCYTFHGLCSSIFSPTPDDETMHIILDNRGTYVQTKEVTQRRICVDESQDLKAVYVKLILALISRDAQWFLVGDEIQMLNDYDEDDPALLEFMQNPEKHFGEQRIWRRTRLSKSFRLTPLVTEFVNAMLEEGEQLVSGNTQDPSVSVRVCTVGNWRWKDIILNWIRYVRSKNAKARIFVLVARKKNNPPLQLMVNAMSTRGIQVYIHGVDGQDTRIQQGKITISTFHASKGMQCDACAVLGVEDLDKHNPLHVALSRTKSELLVVQNSMRPRKQLIKTTSCLNNLVLDDATSSMNAESYVAPLEYPQRTFKDLSNWSARGRCVSLHALVTDLSITDGANHNNVGKNKVEQLNRGQWGEVYQIYRLAAMMKFETENSGRCRFIDFMKTPVRYKNQDKENLILQKSHNYTVDSRVLDNNELIPNFAWKILRTISDKGNKTVVDWCTLAAIALSWNKFHHTLSYTIPCDWADEHTFSNCFEVLKQCLGGQIGQYDVRLVKQLDGFTFHCRCYFETATTVFSVIYADEITRSSRIETCIPLALHPTATSAYLINILTGAICQYSVSCKDTFVQLLK